MTYVLQMADTSDYSALVGRTEGLIPEKMPGRGLIKHSPPLEFQTALPFAGQHEAEISGKIRELCAEMRSRWHRKPVGSLLQEAAPIRIAEFHAMIAQTESPTFVVPLGVAADGGTPKLLTLDRHHSCLISATGKETIRTGVFATIMESIVAANGRAELHLIDTELSMRGWKQHVSVGNYISDSAHLLEVTRTAIEQLQLRKKVMREAVPSGLPEEELAYMYSRYPTLVFCIPDLWAAVNRMENESRDQFERITRHGAGLGVFVLAAADAGQLARLQLLDPLTRALIARRASIVLGGTCKDHAPVAEGHGLPSSLSNRLLHDDEAMLLTDGEQSLIRIPVRQ
jgi:S-DNA-T family DNA segregation ATPase FtsK/SpoIIIE